MREIEKIANENFNGHIEDALESLIKNKDSRFGKIVKELNKKEATFAFQKSTNPFQDFWCKDTK